MTRTVAVYGGAFDPPHLGHEHVLQWVLEAGKADVVLLVPSGDHPLGKQMQPFAKRARCCEAMARRVSPDRIIVSDVETRMPPPHYTLLVLRQLRAEMPDVKIRFVMGADNLLIRHKWYGFDDIMHEFDPILVNREGYVPPPGFMVESPMFNSASSTEVRDRLAVGAPVSDLMALEVLAEFLA